jgi:hypothetical protein
MHEVPLYNEKAGVWYALSGRENTGPEIYADLSRHLLYSIACFIPQQLAKQDRKPMQ